MIPEDVFKRRPRHNNTPESILLIIANFIVVSVGMSIFTDKHRIHWFFYIVLTGLAVYNYFTIKRNRHEYDRFTIVAYVISLLALIGMFFVLRGKA